MKNSKNIVTSQPLPKAALSDATCCNVATCCTCSTAGRDEAPPYLAYALLTTGCHRLPAPRPFHFYPAMRTRGRPAREWIDFLITAHTAFFDRSEMTPNIFGGSFTVKQNTGKQLLAALDSHTETFDITCAQPGFLRLCFFREVS